MESICGVNFLGLFLGLFGTTLGGILGAFLNIKSNELGIALAIAICIHDFPEGLAMAIPMKQGGIDKNKVVFYTMMSGISTGIGAFIGIIIGSISKEMIGVSLGYSAGSMLYIVICEIIPEFNELYKGRLSKIGNILGLLIGMVII